MDWFIEKKTPMGKWSPQIVNGEKPTEMTVDGPVTFRNAPMAVPASLRGFPVDLIKDCLSPDGKFHDLDLAEFGAFLRDPSRKTMVVPVCQ